MAYQIFTDATCDLPQEIIDKYHLEVLPMPVVCDDGTSFLHYPDFREMSAGDFYAKVRNGMKASTSQVNPQTFIDYFSTALKKGFDVLYIGFSSAMSATFSNSLVAKDQLMQEYPDRKILCVDSLCASAGEGLFVLLGCENQEKGMSIEDNSAFLNDHKLNMTHYFTVGELDTLKRGGRVKASVALIGSALKIKPVMIVDNQGELKLMTSAHGRKASLKKLLEYTLETIEDPANHTIIVAESDCHEEALKVKEMILEKIPCKEVILSKIGPVVGAHAGPETLCIFSYGKARYPEQFQSKFK